MFFSLIIPIYNRPEDIEDLLPCLAKQTVQNFEVIIVESGSQITSESVVNQYKDQLDIQWYMYKNDGQGFSRNYGMTKAKGDYLVILDSDILVDATYVENLDTHLKNDWLDAFGGPDKAHDSFTTVQKSIDYTMTSLFTTGGIRGNKKHVGQFYPRSFNMGFSREVYEQTKGFNYPYFGEDIDLSERILQKGYIVGLIESAYVYHKRKKDFIGLFKQMFFFGRARIQISLLFPKSLKLTHFFPTAFTLYTICSFLLSFINTKFSLLLLPIFLYMFLIFMGGTLRFKNIGIGFLATIALYYQMFGYGLGFLKDFIRRIVFKQDNLVKNKD